MKKILLIAIVILNIYLLPDINAQYFNSGTNKASIKWEQIKTEYFRIIYDHNFRECALELSAVIDSAYLKTNKGINSLSSRFDVVLHTNTTRSNGMVIWAPKKAEFYIAPPQRGYSQIWIDQLILHELRHVGQINQIKSGITKILYPLFGQHLIGAVSAHFPGWVFEGDAVLSETKHSLSGRGRSPEFFRILRTRLLTDSVWRYDFVKLGSYTRLAPNQYHIGYPIITYVNAKTENGKDPMPVIIKQVGRNAYNPNAINSELKKATGKNVRDNYDASMRYIARFWKNQVDTTEWTKPDIVHNSKHGYYTNYTFPYKYNNTLYAYRWSKRLPGSIIEIDKNGKEKVLVTPSQYSIDKISYAKDIAVWAGYIPGASHIHNNYNDIFLFNLKTKKLKRLSHYKRYFSADIDSQAKQIAALERTDKGKYNLIFIDTRLGRVFRSVKTPDNIHLQNITWNNSSDIVAATFINNNGKGIITYNINTEKWQVIEEPSNTYMSDLKWYNNQILFTSDYSGTENIFAVDTKTGTKSIITKDMYGVRTPSVYTDTIYYSTYTANGYRIAKKADRAISEVNDITTKSYNYPFADIIDSEKPIDVSDKKNSPYKPEPYTKPVHSVNVHSWIPAHLDIEGLKDGKATVYPGLSLYSQNILNSTTIQGGYYYREGKNRLYTTINYTGWPVKIDLTYKYGDKRVVYESDKIFFSGTKQSVSLDMSLPLNLTNGRRSILVQPYINTRFTNYKHRNISNNELKTGMFDTYFGLYYSDSRKTASADIRPTRGKFFDVGYLTPWSSDQLSSVTYASGGIYMPGIGLNHSIMLRGGWYRQDTKKYIRSSILSVVKGVYASNTFVPNLARASVSYTLPLWHPDANLLGAIYIKRLRVEIHEEYARIWNSKSYKNLDATAIDLNIDYQVFRTTVPVSTGVRFIYNNHNQQFTTELLFNVSFRSL